MEANLADLLSFRRPSSASHSLPSRPDAGKKRRVTFVECPPDLNGMIDAAKYADLVLLLIDGGFGFEMETFEFLNLLQVRGRGDRRSRGRAEHKEGAAIYLMY